MCRSSSVVLPTDHANSIHIYKQTPSPLSLFSTSFSSAPPPSPSSSSSSSSTEQGINKDLQFDFDAVCGPHAKQEDIFDLVRNVVEKCIDGFHGTIFGAYCVVNFFCAQLCVSFCGWMSKSGGLYCVCVRVRVLFVLRRICV